MYKITLLWANNVYACTYFICSGSSCKSSSFTCKLYVHRWTSGEEYIKIMYVHVHVTIIGHIISQAKLATHTELEPRWVPDWIEGFGADIGSVEGLTKLHLCIVCIQRTLKKHESVQLSCGARYLEIPKAVQLIYLHESVGELAASVHYWKIPSFSHLHLNNARHPSEFSRNYRLSTIADVSIHRCGIW